MLRNGAMITIRSILIAADKVYIDPMGPEEGKHHVVKGPPGSRPVSVNCGFRIVTTAAPSVRIWVFVFAGI